MMQGRKWRDCGREKGPRASGAPGILQQRLMGDFCAPGAVKATRFHKQGAQSVNRCRHSAGTASRHGSTTGPVYNQASWDPKYQCKGAFAQLQATNESLSSWRCFEQHVPRFWDMVQFQTHLFMWSSQDVSSGPLTRRPHGLQRRSPQQICDQVQLVHNKKRKSRWVYRMNKEQHLKKMHKTCSFLHIFSWDPGVHFCYWSIFFNILYECICFYI